MSEQILTLSQLGWRPYFQQQLTLDDLTDLQTGRIIEQHRSSIIVLSEQGQVSLLPPSGDDRVCVGDWVLFDENLRIQRVLDRQSLFDRKAPGSKVATQLIAANVDNVMIVCSLNNDFNLSRIERYLAIAKEAEVEPVVVLTKADLCDDADDKQDQVQKLNRMMSVYSVNALDTNDLVALHSYCKNGQTIAFLGSSGVGKSTLVNGLLGFEAQETGDIREDDSKGRHTTTYRALKLMPQGGLLMDTPGMRELQLSDCEKGVSATFSEITDLAEKCRFGDCTHIAEPGCAVLKAVESGELEERRLVSFQKLMREQAINGASVAEQRAKDKAFGKMVHGAIADARSRKKDYDSNAY